MDTEILKIDGNGIERAVQIVKGGGLVGMPTETVYGLGADGTNPDAVKSIFEVKGRPADNPLIAHVHKDFDLSTLVNIKHDYVYLLINAFMPGPLTIVAESKGVVCKEAVCGGTTLAVRMPSHEGCQRFLREVNLPIVAPSANISKHTSPVTAQFVFDDLKGKIPLILDGGRCDKGIESTVLDITCETPRILRAGSVTREDIVAVVGKCEIAEHKEGDKVRSPGVKYQHYRPRCQTALYGYEQTALAAERYDAELAEGKTPYIMCPTAVAGDFAGKNLLLLGNTAEEIAHNLYYSLLKGEKLADIIIAVAMPDESGVYAGVMNRLRKSCG